jgi:hypothetical protein
MLFAYNGRSRAHCLTGGVTRYMDLTCTHIHSENTFTFDFQQGVLSKI